MSKKFHRKKTMKKTLKNKVAKIQKEIAPLLGKKSYRYELSNTPINPITVKFDGNLNTVTLQNAASLQAILTNLPVSFSASARNSERVHFKRLWGQVCAYLPNLATYAVGGVIFARAIIIKSNEMQTDNTGLGVQPTIVDTIGVNSPTNICDLDFQISVDVAESTPPQYKIVADSGVRPIYQGGTKHAFIWNYNVKCPKGEISTYANQNGDVGSLRSNHYQLYLFIAGQNALTANNVPVTFGNYKSLYHSM